MLTASSNDVDDVDLASKQAKLAFEDEMRREKKRIE